MKRSTSAEALHITFTPSNTDAILKALGSMVRGSQPFSCVRDLRCDLSNIGIKGSDNRDWLWVRACITQSALGAISGACKDVKACPFLLRK